MGNLLAFLAECRLSRLQSAAVRIAGGSESEPPADAPRMLRDSAADLPGVGRRGPVACAYRVWCDWQDEHAFTWRDAVGPVLLICLTPLLQWLPIALAGFDLYARRRR